MRISFNTYCDNLSAFGVQLNNHESITIGVTNKRLETAQQLYLEATNGEDKAELILEVTENGMCSFGTEAHKRTVPLDTAHCAGEFYFYAPSSTRAYCKRLQYTDVDITVHGDELYIVANIPGKTQNGMIVTEYDFKQTATVLLTCLAKLLARYIFDKDKCAAVEPVCYKMEQKVPELNERLLQHLKEEYPVAYEEYTVGRGDNVLPMILQVMHLYGE